MKNSEKGTPKDEQRTARELIESAGLESTDAGRYMEGEPLPKKEQLRKNAPEETPIKQASIDAFLEVVDELTSDDKRPRKAGLSSTRMFGAKLLDGRTVSVWRVPDEDTDRLTDQAIAYMGVRERGEEGNGQYELFSLQRWANGEVDYHRARRARG